MNNVDLTFSLNQKGGGTRKIPCHATHMKEYTVTGHLDIPL